MTFIIKSIAKVLRMLWRLLSLIRVTLANLLLLVIILLLVSIFRKEAPPPLPAQAALHLELSGTLVEQPSLSSPLQNLGRELFGSDQPMAEIELSELIWTIRQAAADDRITGIVMEPGNLLGASQTMLAEVGQALTAFKDAGKPVYAVADNLTQNQYFLASYADEIYLNPAGAVLLQGYQRYPLYFQSALEKLKISTHIFRVGTYKAAVEPFMRDDMSPAAKEDSLAWINQMWQTYTDQVATNRGIRPDQVLPPYDLFQQRFTKLGGDLAAYARDAGLVDKLMTHSQIEAHLGDTFGYDDDQHSFRGVDYDTYLAALPGRFRKGYQSDRRIGLIVASGPIVDGIRPAGSIGGESTARLLRQARDDDTIHAVVLRIDSPGGSAFASEQISHAVSELRAAGKPVIVSMGTLAASGGYWIASYGDKIVAAPTTTTGSIGIFGLFATFEQSLSELGIHSDGIGTSPWADIHPARPLTPETSAVIQQVIEHGYRKFTGVVAQNRALTAEQVEQRAEGRVWTGTDALRLGLVDQLGTLDDAIALAAEQAGLDKDAVVPIELPLSPGKQLLRELFGQVDSALANGLLQQLGMVRGGEGSKVALPLVRQLTDQLAPLLERNDPHGLYAECLTCTRL